MLKESYLSQIITSENFQRIVQPLPPHDAIRDAEFYIRRDGILFNADGYAHPPRKIVGAVLYTPDAQGNKQIFGVTYRKTTLYPGTYEPIPYAERSKHFREIDPVLDQEAKNSFPFMHEHILPISEFMGYIPAKHVYECAVKGFINDPSQIQSDLEDLATLLGVDLKRFTVGLTGAAALGCIRDYHDLDVVFRGDLKQNRDLANKMRDLVLYESERRLHEGGKSWLIRFFNRGGVTNGTLMCCFFGYQDIEDAPLREFTMSTIERDIEINASVSDATHALYTPTVVTLHDVQVLRINGQRVKERLSDNIPLVIYHTGSRGELNSADYIWAHGVLVEIKTPQLVYPAIVVVEREGVRNETPPWLNYYSRPRV